MLKKLSNLSDARLDYYLERIKEISAHEQVAALIETDKLIWEIWEEDSIGEDDDDDEITDDDELDDEDEDSFAPEALETAEKAVELNRQRLASGEKISQSNISQLEYLHRQAQYVLEFRRVLPESKERVRRLNEEVPALVLQLAAFCFDREIQNFMTCPMMNIISVQGVLRDLEISKSRYLARGLSFKPDHLEIFEKILERCAWMRASKKISSAKVAEASNQKSKANTLRKEAMALLEQDWELVFPEMPLPESARRECLP